MSDSTKPVYQETLVFDCEIGFSLDIDDFIRKYVKEVNSSTGGVNLHVNITHDKQIITGRFFQRVWQEKTVAISCDKDGYVDKLIEDIKEFCKKDEMSVFI